jgi:hypothetical protein
VCVKWSVTEARQMDNKKNISLTKRIVRFYDQPVNYTSQVTSIIGLLSEYLVDF